MRNVIPILFVPIGLLFFSPSHATNIVLDYSHDSATDNFFGRHPVAKAAVDQAATDISSFLASTLTSINPDQNSFHGLYLDSTVSIDMRLNYSNPSTGQPIVMESPTIDSDEVRIYVGMSEINSATQPNGNNIAGLGATGSVGVAISANGVFNQFGPAIESAEQMANERFRRGSTPVTQTVRFDNLFGNVDWSLDIAIGSIIGSLQLDIDTDNNGTTDSDALLNNYWHFDHTSPVAEQKTDLYSVALHEMLHAIGFGSSESWQSLTSGSNWNGSNAIALNGGTGEGLLTGDYAHIRQSYVSRSVVDGSEQPPVMTPSIFGGTRQYLTDLDLAFLEDIGWDIQAPPLAGDFDDDGDLDQYDINRLTDGIRNNDPTFDLTRDGSVDGDDRVHWISELKGTWFGDANLDGEFNSSDLIAVFTTAKFESGAIALWEEGDWDGDQQFSTSDFIVAFSDGGFELGPKVATLAVPEPESIQFVAITSILISMRFRRERKQKECFYESSRQPRLQLGSSRFSDHRNSM